MLQSLCFYYSIYSKLKCNFIKMRLRGKCFSVNLLHIFGTPIRKYTGGLLVGGMLSMSMFVTWMHVYFILFDRIINTVFCQCVFYFNDLPTCVCCTSFIRPWLEYQTSSILLCSHGAYCLRVCTRKIFSRFQSQSSKLPPTLTFVWQQLEAWDFAQGILNTTVFEWCKYISCDDHGLTRADNDGLKPGLYFFSFEKVNKQNKHIHVW